MATLMRWDPLREIDTLQRQMNHLFDDFYPTPNSVNGKTFVPAAELEETPEAIHLKLEVPGLDANDLDIQVTAEAVAITGERRTETKTEDKGMTRSEFCYGKFQRVIPLPSRIQNGKVEAKYENGILNLNLPKAEEEKSRLVKVNVTG